MSPGSWNIFSGPGGAPKTSAEHFIASPFTRLARVHAFQVAGDALIALALANSLGIDVAGAVEDEMRKNERKYPVAEFRGRYG